jgi:hypothetical protein
VIDEIEIPSFQSGGAFINLDRVLFERVVQSGESLVVEVVTSAAGSGRVAAERLRFTDMIDGDLSNWVSCTKPQPALAPLVSY